MTTEIYKVYLPGGVHLYAKGLTIRPNRFGGPCWLCFDLCETLWTGHTHLPFYHGGTTELLCTDIAKIMWRSNLDETDEPWQLVCSKDSCKSWRAFIKQLVRYRSNFADIMKGTPELLRYNDKEY